MSGKAKEQTATLFVRIPVALKERIRRSARARHVTMTEEAARVLKAQLDLDPTLPERVELQCAKVDQRIRKFQEGYIALLEGWLADAASASDPDEAVTRLRESHGRMQEKRLAFQAQREQAEQERKDALELERLAQINLAVRQLVPQKHSEDSPTKEDLRRVNLRKILDKKTSPAGTKTKLAKDLGWSQSQVSQLLSEPTAKGHRPITDSVAPKIESSLTLEAKALEKPLDEFEMLVHKLEKACQITDAKSLKAPRRKGR